MSRIKIVTSDGVQMKSSTGEVALISESNVAVLVSSEQGPRGPRGEQGEQGPKGDEGPAAGDVIDLALIFENGLV